MSVPEPNNDPGERRFTLMVVPENGRGRVRQWSVTDQILKKVSLGGVVFVLCVGGVSSLLSGIPGQRTRAALLSENASLQSDLEVMAGTIADVEEEFQRIEGIEEKLRGLLDQGLISQDEFDLLGVPEEVGTPIVLGEFGWPMDDIPEASAALSGRLADLHQSVMLIRPQFQESVSLMELQLSAIPSIWPVDGVLSSGFGMRRSPIDRRWRLHTGLDIAAPRGTPVFASAAGEVVRAEYNGGYGLMVEIDHGNGIKTRYGHHARLLVEEGQRVMRGDLIATVGSTGRSTGPHVHFEVFMDGRIVDPMEYVSPP